MFSCLKKCTYPPIFKTHERLYLSILSRENDFILLAEDIHSKILLGNTDINYFVRESYKIYSSDFTS